MNRPRLAILALICAVTCSAELNRQQIERAQNPDEFEFDLLVFQLSYWDELQGNPDYDPQPLDERAYYSHALSIGQAVRNEIDLGIRPTEKRLREIFKSLRFQRVTLEEELTRSGYKDDIVERAIDHVYDNLVKIGLPDAVQEFERIKASPG